MKVVVTGGRNYFKQNRVWEVLDGIHADTPITLIVTGACPYGGADLLAENWAKENEIAYFGLPAKFSTLGGKAGPMRNGEMLDLVKPDLVVAFPGRNGTADCKTKATKRNIPVTAYED